MIEEALKNMGIVGGGILFGFAWIVLLWNADGGISKALKIELSQGLKSLSNTNTYNWQYYVLKIFNNYFGDKYFTWKAFIRSVFLSTCFVLVFYTIFLLNQDSSETIFRIINSPVHYLQVLFAFIFASILGDYISICETRFVLNKIKNITSIIILTIILYIELEITVWIFDLFSLAGKHFGLMVDNIVTLYFSDENEESLFYPKSIFYGQLHPAILREQGIWQALIHEILFDRFNRITDYIGVFAPLYFPILISTLITSFWIWLYVISYALIKCINTFNPCLNFMLWALPINEKPLRSIGIVMGIVGTIVFWLISILVI